MWTHGRRSSKLSQVGLSPSDLKLSTRRSQRGSSMFSAASFSSVRSLNSSKSSAASSRRVKSNDNFSIGSLQSVKSTGDVFEAENDEDISEASTKDIDMVLDEINDVTEVTETGEKSL